MYACCAEAPHLLQGSCNSGGGESCQVNAAVDGTRKELVRVRLTLGTTYEKGTTHPPFALTCRSRHNAPRCLPGGWRRATLIMAPEAVASYFHSQ
eukprot:jgi/Botrbrau1/2681/Bobra.0203s0025.1